MTYAHLVRRLRERYRVAYLCTDHYPVYQQNQWAKHHVQSKAETCLVESCNSLIRHYLARFNRKTKRYSKAIDMMEVSLWLLFNKSIIL